MTAHSGTLARSRWTMFLFVLVSSLCLTGYAVAEPVARTTLHDAAAKEVSSRAERLSDEQNPEIRHFDLPDSVGGHARVLSSLVIASGAYSETVNWFVTTAYAAPYTETERLGFAWPRLDDDRRIAGFGVTSDLVGSTYDASERTITATYRSNALAEQFSEYEWRLSGDDFILMNVAFGNGDEPNARTYVLRDGHPVR